MAKYIQLTRGLQTLVDDDVFEWASKLNWHSKRAMGAFYACRSVYCEDSKRKQRPVRLHRVIVDAKPGQVVDHINGDTLDNRKENLRICTFRENMLNQGSRREGMPKGVIARHGPWGQRWRAIIQIAPYKRKNLGTFESIEAAAEAVRKAGELYHGEFFKPQ